MLALYYNKIYFSSQHHTGKKHLGQHYSLKLKLLCCISEIRLARIALFRLFSLQRSSSPLSRGKATSYIGGWTSEVVWIDGTIGTGGFLWTEAVHFIHIYTEKTPNIRTSVHKWQKWLTMDIDHTPAQVIVSPCDTLVNYVLGCLLFNLATSHCV